MNYENNNMIDNDDKMNVDDDEMMSDLIYNINNIKLEEDSFIDEFSKMNIKIKRKKIINFHLFSFNTVPEPINFNYKKSIKYKKNISYVITNLIKYKWNHTMILPSKIPINKKSIKQIISDLVHPSTNGDTLLGYDDNEVNVSKMIQNDNYCINIINKLNIKNDKSNFVIYSIAICLLNKPPVDENSQIREIQKFTLLSNIDYKSILNKKELEERKFIIYKKINLIEGIFFNYNYTNKHNVELSINLNRNDDNKLNMKVFINLKLLLSKLSKVYPLIKIIKN